MFLINIDGTRMNTKERRDKAAQVALEMYTVLNSENFKRNFLRSPKHYGELSLWKLSTLEEIYTYLLNGSEILSPELDNELDLFVDDYYTPLHVVGHTYPNDPFIYANTKYFDSNSTKYIGSFFVHEYGHKKGFDHDYDVTFRRDFSLCYLLNKAYEKSWDEVIGKSAPSDKVLVCYKKWLFFKRCYWETAPTHEITI